MRGVLIHSSMVNSGSLAMTTWEPGQARKGAAVLRDSCAEKWLEFATQSSKQYSLYRCAFHSDHDRPENQQQPEPR